MAKTITYLLFLCCLPAIAHAQVIHKAVVNQKNVRYEVQENEGSIYYWEVEDGIIDSGQGQPTIYVSWKNLPGRKTIKLVEKSPGGCQSDTVFGWVIVRDEIEAYVPNAFTPNGDGINDVFMPRFDNDKLLYFKMLIVNRWGEIVYESTNPNDGWNGEYNGIMCPAEVYSWQIEVGLTTAPSHFFKGTFVLMR